MELSISNIAWDISQDFKVSRLLNQLDIKYIDVAPSKYFHNILTTKDSDIADVKTKWLDCGISIYGMQSLLYGIEGSPNLFESNSTRQMLLNYLDSVCRIGSGLGVKHLTFGSPKNRNIAGIHKGQAEAVASGFFYSLGELAKKHNVIINIEPNPRQYHCNYCVNSVETARVVNMIDHPNIKMQLDTGAIIMNEEGIASLSYDKLGHIHISEPNLKVLGTDEKSEHNHGLLGPVLSTAHHGKIATIEMLTSEDEIESINEIRAAVNFVRTYYK